MANLNDPDLLPVSFRRGGLTHEGQVHIEGTYAYFPREVAEMSEDDQVDVLGDVYFSLGIRRGFTPASESYLAAEYQRRIAKDKAAGWTAPKAPSVDYEGTEKQATGPIRNITGGPVIDEPLRPLTADEGETVLANSPIPQGYEPQRLEGAPSVPGNDQPRTATAESTHLSEAAPGPEAQQIIRGEDGEAPQGYEPTTKTTDTSLTATEKAIKGLPNSGAEESSDDEPFEGARKATIPQTREALANATDDEIARFVAWEKQRTDREPRSSLLAELEG